jgi:hypothetical protein
MVTPYFAENLKDGAAANSRQKAPFVQGFPDHRLATRTG